MTILVVFVCFSKLAEFLHVAFTSVEKHHPVFFPAGLLFVFEILRMQKLVFVVAPARDCKDGNFRSVIVSVDLRFVLQK